MQNLTVIENELVPVYETSTGEKVVYGSELHEVLGVKSRYREWIDRRFSDIDAVENEDFQAAEISAPSGQNKKDHIIKLDTAKEMAMLERNAKGKQVRRYFIQVEKKFKAGKTSKKVQSAKKERLPSVNMMVKNIKEALHDAGVDSKYIAAEVVSAIIQKLDLFTDEIVRTAYSRNGHDGVTMQYKESVFQKVKEWLQENGYPTVIEMELANGNVNKCRVLYGEVA